MVAGFSSSHVVIGKSAYSGYFFHSLTSNYHSALVIHKLRGASSVHFVPIFLLSLVSETMLTTASILLFPYPCSSSINFFIITIEWVSVILNLMCDSWSTGGMSGLSFSSTIIELTAIYPWHNLHIQRVFSYLKWVRCTAW